MASTRRLAIGAVIALGMAIVGVSVTGTPLVNRHDYPRRRAPRSVIISNSGDTFSKEAEIC
jgi:hypothetical protein